MASTATSTSLHQNITCSKFQETETLTEIEGESVEDYNLTEEETLWELLTHTED